MGQIAGQYFSWTSASVVAGQDLITIAKARSRATQLIAKKLTIISSGSLAIDINNLGVDSTLFQDADGLFKVSLDSNDCIISSIEIGQTSACPVFVAMVF
jgi:hypothetical protein